MKKLLGLLAGAVLLFGGASLGVAGGHRHHGHHNYGHHHHGHHSSWGFSFAFPGFYYSSGCYAPSYYYYRPSPVYYSYPSWGYSYGTPVYYGYGYYPRYCW
jgi:hypothetical protein